MRRIIIRSFSIYETREKLLLVGECWDTEKPSIGNEGFRVIEIRRPVESNEKIDAIHHTTLYSQREIMDLLKVQMVSLLYTNCFCLIGIIQLLRSHYLMVVTKAEAIASIHGRDIFAVQDSVLVPITFKMRNTFDDSRYKSIFQSAQFSKGFYFSFSLDITNNLQSISNETLASPAYRYVWNSHLLDTFLSLFSADKDSNIIDNGLNNWVVFMTHGYINQQNIPLVDGRCIRYTLISRRSQYFAGTRYLRRGVNADGNVANEVETEQIITLEDNLSKSGCYRSSSLMQLRGSLPLCWSHNNIFAPNPDIFIDTDDIANRLTRLHMNDMANRYGTRFHVLNLIRMSESHREKKLGHEMKSALFSLSSKDFDSKLISQSQVDGQIFEDHEFVVVSDSHSMKLRYLCYDVLAHEQIQQSVFDVLSEISKSVLPDTGFFLQGENTILNEGGTNVRNVTHKFQEGILRTNCVDCLDRTNIAQFCYAKYALNEQLKALDVDLTPSALDSLQLLVLEIWVQNGDVLALQYAGSEAMHKVEEKKRSGLFATDSVPSIPVSTGAVSDISTSLPQDYQKEKDTEYVLSGSTYKAIAAVRRYYSNVSSDFERQRAMDLLLGVYQTSENNHKHIWEIDQRPHIMRVLHMPSKFSFLRALCDKEQCFRPLFPFPQSSKHGTHQQQKLRNAAQLRGAYHQDDFYNRSSLTSFESIANQSFNKHALHQLTSRYRIPAIDHSRREIVDQYSPHPTKPSRSVIACDEEDRIIEEGFLAYLEKDYCLTGREEEESVVALALNRSDDIRGSRAFYERSLRNMLRPLETTTTSISSELFSTISSAATSSLPSKCSSLRKKEKRKYSRKVLGDTVVVEDFLTFFPPLEEVETGSELDQNRELRSFQSPRLDAIGEGIKSFIALSSGLSFGLPELNSTATSDEVKEAEVVNIAKASIDNTESSAPSVFSFPSKWFSFT